MDYDYLFSQSRMFSYRQISDTDELAEKLYYWNIELSSALYEPLMLLEVALRNAIDYQLRNINTRISDQDGTWHSADWLLDPNQLVTAVVSKREIDKTRSKLSKELIEPTHDDILAQMTFGTWRYILPSKDSARKMLLWDYGLKEAFSLMDYSLEELVRDLSSLNLTRNRIAHGEPLLAKNYPKNTMRRLYRVAEAIDPQLSRFIKTKQRVTQVAKKRPS
jgi:hypothetical protein